MDCSMTSSSVLPVPCSLLRFLSIESVMRSKHLILCHPFSSRLQLSSIKVFSDESTLGGQTPRASASATILPVNIQSLFPLGMIGLISLQSRGLSRVFSNTTIHSINSLALGLLYGPTLTSVHACMLGSAWLFATPKTAVHQEPLFMEFSRQEYWSGFPLHTPRDWLLFWLRFQSSALWCPLPGHTVLGFLWPWTWDISSQPLQHPQLPLTVCKLGSNS